MKKILSALVLFSFVFVAINASAQKTTQQTTTTKQNPGSVSTTTDQTKIAPKDLAVKVTDWMKTNVGDITDAQAGRINVATTNLLTKVRDIRTNVTDAETRKYQIHLAMQTFNGQITSVLTAEQATTYKAKKKQLVTDFKEMKDETETVSE